MALRAQHYKKAAQFLAGTIFLSGCGVMSATERPDDDPRQLSRGAELLAIGDYGGAVRENQRLLTAAGREPPADEALFRLGLVYADPNNPDRNHDKAVQFFRKLLWDFPRSPLAAQTKIWIATIEENGRILRQREKVGGTQDKLSRENRGLAQENQKLSAKNQGLAQEKQKLQQENEKLSQENHKLKEVIEKTKRVDLDIEQKKRETER